MEYGQLYSQGKGDEHHLARLFYSCLVFFSFSCLVFNNLGDIYRRKATLLNDDGDGPCLFCFFSTELIRSERRALLGVGQGQFLEFFARPVVVVAVNLARELVVANVVETCKACARDTLDTVIRDQKVLLPPHKDDTIVRVSVVVLELFLRERVRHVLEWFEESLQ